MTNIAFAANSDSHLKLFESYVAHFENKCQEKLVTKFFSTDSEFFSNTDSFDVVFFDAETNDPTNSEIALKVKRKYPHSAIVILTKDSQDILEFDKFDGLFFETKPIAYSGFISLMKKVLTYVKRNRLNQVNVTTAGNENATINTLDIIYLEYQNKSTVYHTSDKDYVINHKVREVEKDFLYDSFFEIDSGHLVNMRYITAISSDTISINDKILNLSKLRKTFFLNAFTTYMSGILQ